MPWKLVETPFNRHVIPMDDITEHEVLTACWCGAHTDYPHSRNIIHVAFIPTDISELGEDVDPEPPMTEH